MAIPRLGHRRMPRLATKVVTAVAQFALILAFGVAGTIFLGMAIASPIVVPLASRQGVTLSTTDLATAQQLGSMWWLYAIATILSFGAALATLGNLMQRLAASARD
jgi:TRAP-type C4-dicarboxylate transport system permease small subunit